MKVGMNAKKPDVIDNLCSNKQYPIQDDSDGRGIELLYDPAKQLYIFSLHVEDRLLLLIKNDMEKAMLINSCMTKFGVHEIFYVDMLRQRLWRRFIRLELLPLLQNKSRIKELIKRIGQKKYGDITLIDSDDEQEVITQPKREISSSSLPKRVALKKPPSKKKIESPTKREKSR